MKASVYIISILIFWGSAIVAEAALNLKKMESYFESHHDDLSFEMAQGEGKNLKTLAELNGCVSDEAQSAFAGLVRGSFEKIITTDQLQAKEWVQNLQTEVSEDDEVSQLCQTTTR